MATWAARCSYDPACPVRFAGGEDRLCVDHGADVGYDVMGRAELAEFIAASPADGRGSQIDGDAPGGRTRAGTRRAVRAAAGR